MFITAGIGPSGARWLSSSPKTGTGPEFHAGNTRSLRRALARLGTELERHRRQPQGEDLDLDAAVDSYVEVRAGSFPDEDVYIESQRSRRDLSVLVLLDISGSAGEPSGSGGIVHDHQLSAAADLTAALHEVGDRVALYGFRSQGRSAVHIYPVKRFDDSALDADGGSPGRTAPRRVHSARSSHPSRRVDPGTAGRNRPASPGGPVRRVRVRPRLRRVLR